MADAIRHRGPDAEGVFVDDWISLSHRRLSIVDLSDSGRQPMAYERDGRRVVITFNGEIFNFQEIRQQLQGLGYAFGTGTDTEVILASYLEWGQDCVSRFNGMWAFALYEPARRRLLLSRDRFGEKPLHYRLVDGRLIFASEIKAILVHPVRRRAREDVVSDYLYRAEANGRLESFFEDIVMLPPAHNAVFDLSSRQLALQRYYEPRRDSRRVSPEEIRAALNKSVERRMIADVPISISLSGGTDSTSVAALCAGMSTSRIKAFSTTSKEGIGDETALLSHFLARYPQFDLERSELSEEGFCRHYQQLIWHMDEPFARQSAYVRWQVAHLAHAHQRKVLLNGEGADEVLGGYLTFAPRFLTDLWRHGNYIRLGRELWATWKHPERDRIMAAWREARARQRLAAGTSDASALALREKFGITPQPLAEKPRLFTDLKDFLHDWVHRSSLPRLLVCNDKMAMANAVEGRAPFLDHEFVDLAFSMDPKQLLVDGLRKYPLRDAMRGLVPDEILFRRSKDAFHAPIFEYLRSDIIQRRVREVFSDARTSSVFNPKAYLAEYDRFIARQGANRLFLFHGLLLEEWARTFEVDFD